MGADEFRQSQDVRAFDAQQPLVTDDALDLPSSTLANARLRNVLDGMSEGFSLLSPDFVILDLNAEALRLEARPRHEIVGRSHWELYPGSEDGPLGVLYKRAARDRVAVNLEHRHIWDDGRVSWLDMRAFPTDDGCLAVFFRDVTERHIAEQKVRESAERFAGAVSAFADVLWTNDAEGRMTGEQPGWAALTGQSFDDYQGYGWSQAVHPDDAQPTIDAWQEALDERRLFVFEHRVRRHDGKWRRFAIRAVPVLNNDGSIREWVGVHSDITDLRESEVRFRQLAENIEVVFYVHEIDDMRVSYVSPAYERIWQQTAHEIYADAKAFMRDIHPDDRPKAEASLQRQRKGKSTDTRYRLVLPDGSVRHIHDRSFVTSNPDAYARRVVGIAEDVTASTEARLLQDVLMREIEHRVRNSLSIVGGLLSMQAGTASNAETAESLKSASSRVTAIARIHERLYKGKNLEVVEFGAYLSALCEDLAATAKHERLNFDVQTTPIDIVVDQAVPLGLVANELITNACKYSGRNGSATIVVRLERDGAALVLSVTDTGPGVPADFDPKARAGLGMQVITALVGQLGGKITMPSAGSEARFEVVLPLTQHLPSHAWQRQ